MGPVTSLLYEAVLFAPYIPLTVLAAFITDKIGRINTILLGLIPTIIGYILIIFFHSVGDLLLIILLLSSWISLSEVPLVSIASELFPTFLRSLTSGLQTSAWRLGFILTSIILPVLLISVGVGGMYLVESIMLIAVACVLLFMLKPQARVEKKSLEEISEKEQEA